MTKEELQAKIDELSAMETLTPEQQAELEQLQAQLAEMEKGGGEAPAGSGSLNIGG